MKKVCFFAAAMFCSFAAFSQNVITSDSVGSVVRTIVDAPSSTASVAKVVDAAQLKQILEGAGKDGTATLVGYNVIVGNNNTIIIVDDQKKAKNYLHDSDDKIGKLRMPRGFFERFAIGVKASTMGLGAELATSVSSNMTLRLGYNYSNFSTGKFSLDVTDEKFKQATKTKDYTPSLETEAKFKQNNGHALLDIYPLRGGVFHITGGVYFGDTKIHVNGQLQDQDGNAAVLDPSKTSWTSLGFKDHYLEVNNDGSMDAELRLGNYVKPYVGIGLGRAIPSKRIGIKFEIGVIYNGNYKVYQNGVELATSDDVVESIRNAGDYTQYIKWYPVASLQLSFRVK